MNSLKVALLQILPGKTLEDNLRIGIEACRKAKEAGADIVLFPEMWSSGYRIFEDTEKLKADAGTAGKRLPELPESGAGATGKWLPELPKSGGLFFLVCIKKSKLDL